MIDKSRGLWTIVIVRLPGADKPFTVKFPKKKKKKDFDAVKKQNIESKRSDH